MMTIAFILLLIWLIQTATTSTTAPVSCHQTTQRESYKQWVKHPPWPSAARDKTPGVAAQNRRQEMFSIARVPQARARVLNRRQWPPRSRLSPELPLHTCTQAALAWSKRQVKYPWRMICPCVMKLHETVAPRRSAPVPTVQPVALVMQDLHQKSLPMNVTAEDVRHPLFLDLSPTAVGSRHHHHLSLVLAPWAVNLVLLEENEEVEGERKELDTVLERMTLNVMISV